LESSSGAGYSSGLASAYAGLPGVFMPGDIPAGDQHRGYLVFVIDNSATGLVLVYPSFPGSSGLVRIALGT